jgi:transposase
MDSDVRRQLLWVKLFQQTRDAGLVCRRCGISYSTFRKWIGRYREVGEVGLLVGADVPPDLRIDASSSKNAP